MSVFEDRSSSSSSSSGGGGSSSSGWRPGQGDPPREIAAAAAGVEVEEGVGMGVQEDDEVVEDMDMDD